jgi:hypothetical protein
LTDPIISYGWTAAELEWRKMAKCVGLGDVMFPNADRELARQAIAICQTCPVTVECGAYAEAGREKGGIWGGRSRVRIRVSGLSS